MKNNKINRLSERLTVQKDGQGSVTLPAKNSDDFAARVGALISAFGSLAELSRKCGIPESTIKKWADGISDPSRERCIALAQGTGVSLMWLVAGVPPMWAKDQSPHERDSQLIALGDPESPEVREAWVRRDQAIKDWSAGMAAGMASQQASQPLRRDDLKMALQLAAEALGDRFLPPEKHAELVTLIYELLEEGLPEAKVLRFARAASA